jgi:hypothetical protein
MTPRVEQQFLMWTGGTALILLGVGWCLRHGPAIAREVKTMTKGWGWGG